jgi:hypothetical protein
VAPRGRPLVIDASVGRTAGLGEHPASSRCFLFLEEALGICHRFLAPDELALEWRIHASPFARRWLRSMSARKKVNRCDFGHDERLRAQIVDAPRHEGEAQQMLKDAHLIETALQLDAPIVSLDDRARNCFKEASRAVRRLRSVVWVNPTADDENPLEWLRSGAESKASRCLGPGVAD